MTNPGQRATQNMVYPGTPGWRVLAVLGACVVAVHALVFQASPAQLGLMPGAADKVATTSQVLMTRRIEQAPVTALKQAVKKVVSVDAASATARSAASPQTAKTYAKNQKSTSNTPVAQALINQSAPEIVANTEFSPIPQPLPAAQVLVESAAASTPTQSAAAPPAGPKSTLVTAVSLPGTVRLDYKVVGLSKNLNYQANAELDWKTDGESYQAMLKVSAFLVGSRSMTSVGKVTGTGLAPTRFADKFKSELAAHFVPEKGKVVFSANTPDAVWAEGMQDRVSVFLQLAGMLAARPQSYPPGTEVTFLTIGPREADSWVFVVEAEESLDLMGAPMAALKLTRKPRKEFDQKVEIWFAPSQGYLPVRSRITQQSGDFIDQQLTGIVRS